MAILVPITFLCTLPYTVFYLVIGLVASLFVGYIWLLQFILFLDHKPLRVLYIIDFRELSKIEQQKKYVVIGLIAGMQMLLYLMFNFYFFKVINE